LSHSLLRLENCIETYSSSSSSSSSFSSSSFASALAAAPSSSSSSSNSPAASRAAAAPVAIQIVSEIKPSEEHNFTIVDLNLEESASTLIESTLDVAKESSLIQEAERGNFSCLSMKQGESFTIINKKTLLSKFIQDSTRPPIFKLSAPHRSA
jgi:hypothetical protein